MFSGLVCWRFLYAIRTWKFIYNTNKSKLSSKKSQEQAKLSSDSFFFKPGIEKRKDENIMNYNLAGNLHECETWSFSYMENVNINTGAWIND
jgi:hypothetical protein